MAARLVALAPDVDLKRLQFASSMGQAVLGQFGLKSVHTSEIKSEEAARLFPPRVGDSMIASPCFGQMQASTGTAAKFLYVFVKDERG
jgi:hypothetical protein